jgi:thioredoxin 1
MSHDLHNFQSDVLDRSRQMPVLVDFWAEWCMPCRMLTPTIDAIASETAGKAKVGKVNVDHHQGIAVKYGIQSIPTVMLFKNGQMVKKWVGVVQKGTLAEALTAP